jgi:hypothetical protein
MSGYETETTTTTARKYDGSTMSFFMDPLFAIVCAAIIFTLIIFLGMAPFIQTHTLSLIVIAAGLALALGKAMLGTNPRVSVPLWYNLLFLVLLLVGGYIVNLSDGDHAWWGALLLTVLFAVDLGYTLYLKKKAGEAISTFSVGIVVVSDLILAILLIVAMVKFA